MAPKFHLLIAGLGKTPDVVCEVVDWFNNRERWPEDRRSLSQFGPVTEVWLVATNGIRTEGGLRNVREKLNRQFPSLRIVPRYACVQDIKTYENHKTMEEIIYRTVLHGHEYKRKRQEQGEEGFLGLCIAGGRKTMSSSLHEAYRYFDVDMVLHVVSELEENSKTFEFADEHRRKVFPFPLAQKASFWNKLFWDFWKDKHMDVPLETKEFGLENLHTEVAERDGDRRPYSDNSTEEKELRPQAKSLADMIEEIATQSFASSENPVGELIGELVHVLENGKDHPNSIDGIPYNRMLGGDFHRVAQQSEPQARESYKALYNNEAGRRIRMDLLRNVMEFAGVRLDPKDTDPRERILLPTAPGMLFAANLVRFLKDTRDKEAALSWKDETLTIEIGLLDPANAREFRNAVEGTRRRGNMSQRFVEWIENDAGLVPKERTTALEKILKNKALWKKGAWEVIEDEARLVVTWCFEASDADSGDSPLAG